MIPDHFKLGEGIGHKVIRDLDQLVHFYCSPLASRSRLASDSIDGRIVGSNFLDERSTIDGIGPVSVDPPVMNSTIGRQLMQAVMDRAIERRFPGVRLLQEAWHYRSLSLYTKLGFDTRETITAMQGLSASKSPATTCGPHEKRICELATRFACTFTVTTGLANCSMESARG